MLVYVFVVIKGVRNVCISESCLNSLKQLIEMNNLHQPIYP